MKTLKDLIKEDSPLLDDLRVVYRINSDISCYISTAKKNPELYSIHRYYNNREVIGFRLLKSGEVILVEGGRLMINKRGVSVDKILNRPDRYAPLYSRIIKFCNDNNLNYSV